MAVAACASDYENMPDLLTARQAGEIANMPTRTVYGLVSTGQLPGVKVGRSIRINKKKFLELLGLGA